MLVLTRKPGQSVFIGDEIKVTLQAIKGNQVRIGVEAPSHVRIYREEIYLQILEENRSAADLSPAASDDLSGVAAAWKEAKKGTKIRLGSPESPPKEGAGGDEED